MTSPKIISSVKKVVPFLSSISPSSTLYLDLEGNNLGRNGSLTLMTMLVYPQKETSIIDIQALGASAFTTIDTTNKSLKTVLENPNIQKYLWDVRNDADALWSHYGVRLTGVTDIQLLENATRNGPRTYVSGLEKSIGKDLGLKPAELQRWTETKKDVKALMSTNIFSRRPIDEKIARYCANDVVHLPALYSIYSKRIGSKWLRKVMDESRQRVSTACSPSYKPQSEEKKFGPWASKKDKKRSKKRSSENKWEEMWDDNIERGMMGDVFELFLLLQLLKAISPRQA